jgi:hypothetical protein
MIAASFLLFGSSAMIPLRPHEITFGHWPQVLDSVWLIATVGMPQDSCRHLGHPLR